MSTPFVISREFDAPQQRVWEAYTDAAHLTRWFGPKGGKIVESDMDFQVGGRWHYGLEFMGANMWGLWEFVDISAPERLSVIQGFSDAQGGVARHPMAPLWPLKTFATTTLAAHGERTVLTVSWVPHEATPAEVAVFDASHASMTMGWSGTFESLEAYLKTLAAGASA